LDNNKSKFINCVDGNCNTNNALDNGLPNNLDSDNNNRPFLNVIFDNNEKKNINIDEPNNQVIITYILDSGKSKIPISQNHISKSERRYILTREKITSNLITITLTRTIDNSPLIAPTNNIDLVTTTITANPNIEDGSLDKIETDGEQNPDGSIDEIEIPDGKDLQTAANFKDFDAEVAKKFLEGKMRRRLLKNNI
ncbi:hypothetical protein BB561_006878, partial [Smittium simulii]